MFSEEQIDKAMRKRGLSRITRNDVIAELTTGGILMSEYYWKLLYALYMEHKTGMRWSLCQKASEAGYEENEDNLNPIEAVDIELSYWDIDD